MNRYQAELYHHGIKGMKWGVRRYQKKDGSLTSAGQKRQERRNEEIDRAKKNESAINSNIKKAEEDLRDLDSKGYNSKIWQEAFGVDANKDDKYFNEYLGYSSKKEAFDLVKDSIKSHKHAYEDSLTLERKKVAQLSKAKITDKSFLEIERAGKIKAAVAFSAISAVGVGTAAFGQSKRVLTGSVAALTMLGISAIGANAAANIVVNTENKINKFLNT